MTMLENDLKHCSVCKKLQPKTEYYKWNKTKDGLMSRCKSCHSTKQKAFREGNKEHVQAQTQARRNALKLKAVLYLGDQCADCLQKYPLCVYDFHHIDPSTKENDVGSLIQSSWEFVKAELDKCVLLCANCHRCRHYL